MSNYYLLIDFVSLSLKVECVTVGGFEREFHFAVALNLSLDSFAVSCVASNVTALWGTSKIFK